MYYVYLIQSLKDGSFYVGMAKDVEARLTEHNRGKSKYTKGHIPYRLLYQEGPYPSEEAREREKYLKRTDVKKRILKNL